MSDTPKTDKQAFSVNLSVHKGRECWQSVVSAEFARGLEREVARLTHKVRQLEVAARRADDEIEGMLV